MPQSGTPKMVGPLWQASSKRLMYSGVVEASDPGERRRIGADEDHISQKTGLLEALHKWPPGGRGAPGAIPRDYAASIVRRRPDR